ncbi:phosphotyrosine protein phosphatase [Cryptosporangium sp. NPDC048952]|uniref:arsenate reductase/protein-tyrosine-phosphatase family protein n=1 Tax=Cryptosporangium sp. NPDC048952 TaxID=3363961 RepID=UPI00371482F3
MSDRFSVLMVCMGNICRSPMAERLLRLRLEERLENSDLVVVHGAGTGAWHEGEPMHVQSAEEVLARGGDPAGFSARMLTTAMLAEQTDLALTATIEQVEFISEMDPAAAPHTFVLGEFARLAARVPEDELPTGDLVARGRALVAAADRLRDGAEPKKAHRSDEVPDPWGRAPEYFTAVADQIDDAVTVLADRLSGE